MSLTVPLNTTKNIVIRPAITKTVSELVIEKIFDDPTNKTVQVFIHDIGIITLPDLSGDNYDNPQWTNENLASALTNYVNSL
jgi:hypothetical protein